jgi:hypothetical protein
MPSETGVTLLNTSFLSPRLSARPRSDLAQLASVDRRRFRVLEPPVGFVGRSQDDRHGLRVDGRNDGVGLSRHKAASARTRAIAASSMA